MKRFYLIFIFTMSCINLLNAGITKLKHTEKDGFTWYEVSYDNGNENCGVMNIDNKMIIPIKYDYIEYDIDDKVFYCEDSNGWEAMWTKEGKCIISEKKQYDDILIDSDGKGNRWISISDKRGLDGACDMNGKLLVEPKYWNVSYKEPDGFFYNNQNDEKNYFLGIKLYKPKSNSFKIFATNYVTERVKAWQMRNEFESTGEWKKRVNTESQKQLVAKLTDEAKDIYLTQNMPKEKIKKAYIGKYDADKNIFPIKISGYDELYVSVPVDEAPNFKEKWSKVDIKPVYGIVNDSVGIESCMFKLGKKEYQLADNIRNNNDDILALSVPDINIEIENDENKHSEALSSNKQVQVINTKIDTDIPVNDTNNTKTFAVIIGNENYQSVNRVSYALNDAIVFAKYCNKTLGIPQKNIKLYCDASYGKILTAIKRISNIAKAYNGDVNIIFYYAGHGIPDETSKSAYLLPVDADGTQTEVCYSINRLFKDLKDTEANSIVMFLDACFSGAQRGNGMLSSTRGVAIKPNETKPDGNIIVFSAATGSQTAFPYNEKGHGMFTYYLLEKLHNSNGNATLKELSDYITMNVSQQSVIINDKVQTPTTTPSNNMPNWATIKLR